jgi:hypothetical protein
MSARQEKVREALGAAKSLAARAPYCGYRADYFDAALAEVEEWEAEVTRLNKALLTSARTAQRLSREAMGAWREGHPDWEEEEWDELDDVEAHE